MTEASLRETVLRIGEDARASAVAVAAYDFEHRTAWSLDAHRWFHAASTIKVPLLLAVYEAIEQGRFDAHSTEASDCPGVAERRMGARHR